MSNSCISEKTRSNMNNNIFEKIKAEVNIRDVIERFGVVLDRNNKANCPFHKEKTASFSVDVKNNFFKCFGCGESGDCIDFVAKIKGVEPIEAVKMIAESFNIKIEENPNNKQTDKSKVAKKQISEYLEKCKNDIDQTDYFQKRGLTTTTIKKFCLGFDTYRKVVTIPYSSKLAYYQTRSTEDKTFYKPKTEDAGIEPLFNGDVLDKVGKEPVFIVESPICAMSIMQCGGVAISLCGVGNISKLISKLDAKFKGILILSLDNDEPGRLASQNLANELFNKNIKFKVINISKDCKDPNELLVQNPKALKAEVQKARQTAKLAFSSIKGIFNCAELQDKNIPELEWIIQDLLPEGLAMLCAPSKYGKSWMMMQLATAVVEGGEFLGYRANACGVVYFALEDGERRYQKRLNIVMKNEKVSNLFNGILESKAMDEGLFEQLQEVLDLFPQTKLIIIDTLQKVRGKTNKNETAYGSDYREMAEFKKFADKNHICILLVHHLRKQMDDSDVFNRISGSMGLMGAADTLWILSRKKRTDTNTTFSLTGRDIENIELVLEFDPTSNKWELLGNVEDQGYKLARKEYEDNQVIKTIKKLVKDKEIWSGTSTELKVMCYEVTGKLYSGSAESIGKVINKYLDWLYADKIEHLVGRGKIHTFRAKQPTLFGYENKYN